MLKQLSNRLHLFLAGILMVIITLILCFSLWNMYQSQQLADISYIQRMTSLIIYQLEDDTSNPQAVLSNYERCYIKVFLIPLLTLPISSKK